MEIWKPTEFEGYFVSNLANVKSPRKILTQNNDHKGYKRVQIKKKWIPVHRLVAKAFIPNPENKPQVNHIDTDKTNNLPDNLEWVTNVENHKHKLEHGLNENATKALRVYTKSIQRKIIQSLDGEFVAEHESLQSASRSVGTNASNIREVCEGKRKSSKGFQWSYAKPCND
jgi:hypothetical protein